MHSIARNRHAGSGIRGRLSRGIALLSALAVTLLSFVALPTAAVANINTGIVVSDVELSNPSGGQLTIGDTASFSGKWDATEANPQPGEQFTIELPSEFRFLSEVSFPLEGPDGDGNNQKWATCTPNTSTGIVTCVLEDVVAGWDEVGGEFRLEITAAKRTTEEFVYFKVNGEDVPVKLPGGGGIDDGVVLPEEITKSGKMNPNLTSMTWTIAVPGSVLANLGSSVVVDKLQGDHKLCDAPNLKITEGRGADHRAISGSIENLAADGKSFEIHVGEAEGSFNPDYVYTITYETCTTDGTIHDKGTKYSNEASIEGYVTPGGGEGIVGEVVQNWEFKDDIAKAGRVKAGADRNGKVQWNVRVNGQFLAANNFNKIDLVDTFGEGHKLCSAEGDLGLNLKIVEHRGPVAIGELGADDVDITLNKTDGGFQALFSPRGDFAFKSYPYHYEIIYETCVISEGLPAAGTAFSNTATINGEKTGTETTVPKRSEGKTGWMNGSEVTLDGEKYSPYTTMHWKIEVPGEKIKNLDKLTVTDEIGEGHQVCGEGDNLVGRLGLQVRAVDQMGGSGGLSGQNITDRVTADLDGKKLTLDISKPTLPMPGGGEETGFSKEYSFIIEYNTCTESGGMDSSGTKYSNAAEIDGSAYGHTIEFRYSGSGTGTGVARGSVDIFKRLAETPGAELVPDGLEFTVHVKEFNPDGKLEVEYDLQIPVGSDTAIQGINSRGKGWTIEVSEVTFPDVPGVVFGDPVFEDGPGVTLSDGGKKATAEIKPRENIEIKLENTALLGEVQVEKIIEGGAADHVGPDTEFDFTAAIDVSHLGANVPEQGDRTFTLKAGEIETLKDLPIGAKVTITEDVPEADDTFTWGAPVMSPETITVESGHAAEAGLVTVTNQVERTVGTFTISKEVEGEQAENEAVPGEVTVTAAWVDSDGEQRSKDIQVPTDGTPVDFGENLLIGTKVTLTETPLADGSSIAWGTPVWSGTGVSIDGANAVVTITRDAEAAVTVTNHAATSTAGLSILKGMAGEAADAVPAGTEFPVTATWTDAEGAEQSKDLVINAEGPTALGVDLPAGTEVTLSEGTAPDLEQVTWGSITFGGERVTDNGDGTATVTISDQQGESTLITVTNEATWTPGTVSVSKVVEGLSPEHPDFPESVTIQATWLDHEGESQTRDLTVPTDGTQVPLGEVLPAGTLVSFTEETLAGTAAVHWLEPTWNGEDGAAEVTIDPAGNHLITVTNTAAPVTGVLAVTKALTGDGAEGLPAGTTFPVTASWVDLMGETQERDLHVVAGVETPVLDVPFGTDITLTEGEAELPADFAWASAEWSSESEGVEFLSADGATATVTITAESDSVLALALTNELTKVPGGLPGTGAGGAGILGAVTIALLAAGAAFVGIARRRAA